jgi:hypothetical protein
MVFTATGAGVAAVGNVMALLIGAWHHPFARDFFSARPEASRECGERQGGGWLATMLESHDGD